MSNDDAKPHNPNRTAMNFGVSKNEQKFSSNKEYFAALEKWVKDAYMWQNAVASFPYFLLASQMCRPGSSSIRTSTNIQDQQNNNINIPQNPEQRIDAFMNVNIDNRRVQVDLQIFRLNNQRRDESFGYQYHIPPLWKRFMAEFVDFLILFLLKLAITFIAVDFFDFIDLEKYNIHQEDVKFDYNMAMEMMTEFLMLESIHRINVCVYEALWLQHGSNDIVGGATPGKTLMGLRVVKCLKVTAVEGRPNVVLVSPGTKLTLPWALARSLVKNLVMTITLPICFALMFFKHNRTGYDIISRSIVVEEPAGPMIRRNMQ